MIIKMEVFCENNDIPSNTPIDFIMLMQKQLEDLYFENKKLKSALKKKEEKNLRLICAIEEMKNILNFSLKKTQQYKTENEIDV